jgi:uncharacterized protein YraI
MTDEFDDLSWLRGQDDEEPSDEEQDQDEVFDWQQPRPGGPTPPPGGHLGFTSQLPWMGDSDSETEPDSGDSLDEEFDLDWLRETPDDEEEPTPRPEPPEWLRTATSELEAVQDPLSDVPDWMRAAAETEIPAEEPDAFAEMPAAEPEPGEEDLLNAVPDWLRGPDQFFDVAEATPPDEEPEQPPTGRLASAVPDWLRGADDALDAFEPAPDAEPEPPEEDLLNAVPDWLLSAAEPPPAPVASMTDDTGRLSPEWLASGAELPDTLDSEQSFDDWMRQQAEAERVPDLEEQLPDLDHLEDTGALSPDTIDTGQLPSWMLGLEELNVEDAPEWFTSGKPGTGGLDDSPLSDWLAQQEPPPAAPLPAAEPDRPAPAPAAEPEEEALFDEDFFAALEQPDSSLDDLFAALGTETPAADSFAERGAAAPEPTAGSAGLDEDFFAALGGETDFDFEEFASAAEPEPGPAAASLPDEDLFAAAAWGELEADEPDSDFLNRLTQSESGFDTGALGQMFGSDLDDEVEPEPGIPDIASVPDGQLLQSLGLEAPAEDEPYDWFAQDSDAPADVTDLEAADWLQNLDELDASALSEPGGPDAQLDDEIAPLPDIEAPGLADIDSLLASMGTGSDIVLVPDTSGLLTDDIPDFDDFFSDPAFSDMGLPEPEADAEPEQPLPEAPDWLTEAGAVVGAVSAAALLRQRDDRPLEELPERLRKLRERGTAATARTAQQDALEGFAPDISDIVQAAGPAVVASGAAARLTPAEEHRVELLRTLTATEQAVAAAAARALSDEPFLTDEDESLPVPPQVIGPAAVRRRLRLKVDRLLIALILAAAVLLPFVADVRIGDLPPSNFAVGSRQQVVFDTLNSLQPGQRVLLGMEYGPTAAGELDSTARVLLQHVLLRGAQPVIVSSNPVALLRADNLLAELRSADGWQPNQDYVVARYLTGGAVGLRSLGENPAPLLAFDLRGQPTGLTIASLDAFAQIIVIAERPDDLRAWAEQIAPLTGRPLVGATGYTGEPLIDPYVGSSLSGLLVGFRDAYTYSVQLATAPQPPLLPLAITPTPEPTAAPVDATPADIPAEETEPPAPSADGLLPGVITGTQNINVRTGPGTGFPVVSSVGPGQAVAVISQDAAWTNIRLPDGVEGWIASQFVRLVPVEAEPAATEAPPTSAPSDTPAPSATSTTAPTQPAASATPLPSSTPLPPTALPTNTPAATATPTEPAALTAPTATPGSQVIARVLGSDRVNVRSGPNTSFAPVGTAGPGDEFVVLGRNADGSWIQVDFPGLAQGQEAWIAAFLLDISVREVPAAQRPDRLIVVMAGSDYSRLLAQPATPTPEQAADADRSTDLPAEGTAVVPAAPPPLSAERRWYAMNLGLVAIIVIILLGAVVNGAQALLRRGK